METLRRPCPLGGFGLLSAVCVSPFAFLASVAASAAQQGSHPLSDTLYDRYTARGDLGLQPPTRNRVLPRGCAACGMGVAADGLHGQLCIYSSTPIQLRHDGIERLLHDASRDDIGLAYRQQHGLPSAERTKPDLLVYLDNQPLLWDVTVVNTLADTHLATAGCGESLLAREAALRKVTKYAATASAMDGVHLPFAVETTGGLGETAQQLIRAVHHSAQQHCTWRDADEIGAHMVDSIAIAVQRCTGMALRTSVERERRVAMSAAAASVASAVANARVVV